jgi:hypothetical protein
LALSVTWKIGDEDAVPLGQQRREQGEVDRSAAEPVDEDERRSVAADEVASTDPANLREAFLEPSKERCLGHHSAIFCLYGLGRSAEPLSPATDMKDA